MNLPHCGGWSCPRLRHNFAFERSEPRLGGLFVGLAESHRPLLARIVGDVKQGSFAQECSTWGEWIIPTVEHPGLGGCIEWLLTCDLSIEKFTLVCKPRDETPNKRTFEEQGIGILKELVLRFAEAAAWKDLPIKSSVGDAAMNSEFTKITLEENSETLSATRGLV